MKKYFHTLSFRFLLSSSIIFVLFTGIILNIWYYILKEEAENTAINNMTHITKISNNVFNSQVNDILNVVSLLSVRTGDYNSNIINILTEPDLTDSELLNYKRTASDFLIKLCSNKDYLNGLYISDFGSRQVSYGVTTPFENLVGENTLSAFPVTERGFYFFPPHINPAYSQKNMVFSIVRPIYSYNTLCGVIVADIKCTLLDDIFSGNANWKGNLFLYDSHTGNFIYNFDSPSAQNPESHPAVSRQLKKAGKVNHFSIKLDGEKNIIVLDHSKLSGWTSVILSPEADIIPGFLHSRTIVLLITGCFFLLTLTINGFLTFYLSKDVRSLTSAVGKITGSSLELPALSLSSSETALLYDNFQAMLMRIKDLIEKNRLKEQEKHKAELRTLQAQINPHFLYNTLNTIKFLAILNGSENIQKVSDSLAHLLHINMSQEVFISVEQEISYLEDYLELQSYSYANQFRYDISADSDVLLCFLPKMLLQPLVENALKHGFKDRVLHNKLNITFSRNADTLLIVIQDNGNGIPDCVLQNLQDAKPTDSHIGLGNVRQRLELYFNRQYTFEIESNPDEYTIQRIHIPVILRDEVNNYV